MIVVGMLVALFGIWAGIGIAEGGIQNSCYEDASFTIDGTEYFCGRMR